MKNVVYGMFVVVFVTGIAQGSAHSLSQQDELDRFVQQLTYQILHMFSPNSRVVLLSKAEKVPLKKISDTYEAERSRRSSTTAIIPAGGRRTNQPSVLLPMDNYRVSPHAFIVCPLQQNVSGCTTLARLTSKQRRRTQSLQAQADPKKS